MSVRLSITFAVILAGLTASFGSALAHADLHHASPEAGSTVSKTPREVSLMFTDTLEPVFSSVDVTNSSGARVDQGKVEVSGNTIRIGLKTLPPGSYRVHWRAVSVDAHKTEGNFTFNVGGQ
jgi:methionine-rich copper-binding protein CopC